MHPRALAFSDVRRPASRPDRARPARQRPERHALSSNVLSSNVLSSSALSSSALSVRAPSGSRRSVSTGREASLHGLIARLDRRCCGRIEGTPNRGGAAPTRLFLVNQRTPAI